MRLIDADELLETVGSYDPKKYTWEYGMVVTVEDIKNAPTVDTEPIRHGSWVGIDDFPHEDWECTNCGYIIYGDDDIRDLHYCPNCGARMDEDDTAPSEEAYDDFYAKHRD